MKSFIKSFHKLKKSPISLNLLIEYKFNLFAYHLIYNGYVTLFFPFSRPVKAIIWFLGCDFFKSK